MTKIVLAKWRKLICVDPEWRKLLCVDPECFYFKLQWCTEQWNERHTIIVFYTYSRIIDTEDVSILDLIFIFLTCCSLISSYLFSGVAFCTEELFSGVAFCTEELCVLSGMYGVNSHSYYEILFSQSFHEALFCQLYISSECFKSYYRNESVF